MARIDSPSSSADQARIRAEAEKRKAEAEEKKKKAEEAKEKQERIKEGTEHHQVSAEAAKFRGKQSQSSFDRGDGKTRREHSTVSAGRRGTTETTRRDQSLHHGAKTHFEETKTTDRHGHQHTHSSSTATTAKGKSATRAKTEHGHAEKEHHGPERNGSATIASKSKGGEIGNKTLASGHANLPGGVKADGSVTGPGAEYSASASAGFSNGDLKVSVDVKVDAHLLAAQGKLEKDVHVKVGGQEFDVKLKLGANAKIGADGELKLDLDIGAHGAHVDASASGFAGAAASLTAGVELDEVKGGKEKELAEGSITGTAVAGASGKAEFKAGYHDGKLGFHAAVQGAVGLGAGLEFNGDVNVGNTLDAVKDVAVGLGKQAVEQLGKAVVSEAKTLGHEVGNLNNYVNGLVDQGFNAAKNVVKDGIHGAEHLVGSGVHEAKKLLSHIPGL